MPMIQVTIAGRSYRMACGEGEEAHLEGVAAAFEAKIAELRGSFGEIGDMRLHVMAALTFVDELAETKKRLAAAEEELAACAGPPTTSSSAGLETRWPTPSTRRRTPRAPAKTASAPAGCAPSPGGLRGRAASGPGEGLHALRRSLPPASSARPAPSPLVRERACFSPSDRLHRYITDCGAAGSVRRLIPRGLIDPQGSCP